MRKLSTLIFTVVTLMAMGCHVQPKVAASLTRDSDRPGWFKMTVRNTSSHTVRFLDIREGTGLCGEFYEITIEKDGVLYGSEGDCLYAPFGTPFVVSLAPGQKHHRDIQPVAYIGSEALREPPYSIMVTYRVSDRKQEMRESDGKEIDLGLTFQTNKVRIEHTGQRDGDF